MKKLSLLIIALLALTVAEAQSIGEQEAWQKASQFFGNIGQKRIGKGKIKAPLKTPELAVAVSRSEFYVFNDEANGGFVIVSGDERLPDVLGYSYDGHFDADNIPCNMQAWLEGYAEQVKFLQEHPEAQSSPRQEVINDYISPLLNCKWNQSEPYNRKCPTIEGYNTVTGCVATAMAQVMYYYQWPKQTAQPIPSYITSTYSLTVPEQPVMSIDWQNILPFYKEGMYSDKQADAVAQLMLLCGAAVQMDYGLGSSGALLWSQVFQDFFDYYGGEEIDRSKYDYQTWCQILYEELKGGHPILYSGVGFGGVHQFILDGYDVVDNDEVAEAYFHVNFGWGGLNDAYYSLNNVDFNNDQYAFVGLRPNSPGTIIPYAVLDKGKMTVYYDMKKNDRSGKVFYWGELKDRQELLECEFDSSFTDYKIMNCYELFRGCSNLKSIKGLNNLNTKYITDMSLMFYECSSLNSLDVSGFNTENLKYINAIFYGCSSLTNLNLTGFNTEKVPSMNAVFGDCSSLTSLDVSGFNTENVSNMLGMFSGCSRLKSLDISGFNTENVTDMGGMFYGCSGLTSLDLSGFKTDNVTNMGSMFSRCSGLTSLDLSGFKTDNVSNMGGMFDGCSRLKSLDLSGFKTDNVTNIWAMFSGCSSMTSLDLSGFKTDNVTNMNSMFSRCSSMKSLDISGFNTENVTDIGGMFYGCSGLKSLDLSGFKTDNVTDMKHMFYGCSGLTSLDLSGFNTNNVTDMYSMFSGCSGLTSLDLSGFNTQNVINMFSMFEYCTSLTTIYASNGWSTRMLRNGFNMFYECINLVGGMGTAYDHVHLDQSYARIDKGPESPGYLTYKENSGIKNLLTTKDKKKSFYSLGGQRLTTPQKGVNIIDGRKVVVR